MTVAGKRHLLLAMAHGAVLGLLSAPAVVIAAPDSPAPQLIAAVSARAERVLPVNYAKYVDNADIRHHWIEGQDRFSISTPTPKRASGSW